MLTTPLAALSLPFPDGVAHYAAGGVLVGLAASFVYLATGVPVGASTFLESTLSYVSDRPAFARPSHIASRNWRLLFTAGIVAGAAGFSLATGTFGWTTEVPAWRLLLGGVLVGAGTRVGKGCTSGHGVCGIGSRSRASVASVLAFVLVAVGVVHLLAAVGVTA